MTEQKKRILESADFIRSCSPFKDKITSALVTYYNPVFIEGFNIVKKVKYSEIPPKFTGAIDAEGEVIFA